MEELRRALLALISNKGQELSIDQIYYIFKDVFRDLETTYAEFLNERNKKAE